LSLYGHKSLDSMRNLRIYIANLLCYVDDAAACGAPLPSSSLTVTDFSPESAVNTDCPPAVTFSHNHDYSDLPVPTDVLLVAANKHIEELEACLRMTEIERFGLERFSSNPKLIKLYTGFPNYQFLYNFLPLLLRML
jgi:hypothetical protein